MPLDHDIPTHLDVADRPALGLTAPQLLLLAAGALAGLGALRQPHLPLAPRLAEGLVPLGVSLALMCLHPAGRSLVAWGCVALLHHTGPRRLAWTGSQDAPDQRDHGAAIRPPHLAAAEGRPGAAGAAMPLRRRDGHHPAAQNQPFVPWAIDGDIVTFRDGHRCAVLECGGINTALMDEEALRATHAAYHAALVGLPWPLQMLVWASPVDLRAHVAAREARLAGLPPALRELESADAAFMRREARRLGLLDHRLFVVIPATARAGHTVPTASLLAAVRERLRRGHPATAVGDNAVAVVLDERCERVAALLAAAGVHARRLSTAGLCTLWYRLLAPRSAALQPFDAGHAAPIARPAIAFAPLEPPTRWGEDDHDA